jgi:DNA-binding MarR family transcriptional regulator
MPNKPKISDLEAHLGYWLRFVSNHVSHAFSRKVEARGVSVAEWVMLRELFDHDTVYPSVLADRLCMTRGAISKIADRLIDKTLIARTESKDDGRYHTLTLTRKGRSLVPALAALADENDEAFFGHLSGAARAELAAAMKEIVRRRGIKNIPVD